jgi:hypothetical protein
MDRNAHYQCRTKSNSASGNNDKCRHAWHHIDLQGAELENQLNADNTYLLYADVVAAGGTQKDIKNILTVLFTGDWLHYSGGLVVNVGLVTTKNPTIVFGDTLRYRTDFTTVKKPQLILSSETVDQGDASLPAKVQDPSHPKPQAAKVKPPASKQ